MALTIDLTRLATPKDFEHLCADLLAAEDFVIADEVGSDTSGFDFRATEQLRSHAMQHPRRICWHVQCKFRGRDDGVVSRNDIVRYLTLYDAVAARDDGLMLMTNGDYSEPARRAVSDFVVQHPHRIVVLWNGRELRARLANFRSLATLYGIDTSTRKEEDALATLRDIVAKRENREALIIADRSAMSYDVADLMESAGLRATFLQHPGGEEYWPITSSLRRARQWAIIALFLGDSFSTPLAPLVQHTVFNTSSGLMLFPFLAWCVHNGMYPNVAATLPVRLLKRPLVHDHGRHPYGGTDPTTSPQSLLFRSDGFAENEVVEISPINGPKDFVQGIHSSFTLQHSFEFLDIAEQSEVFTLRGHDGNPFIVGWQRDGARRCYVNTCCHCCFAPIAISSPMKKSHEVYRLVANAVTWLLQSPTASSAL